MPTTKKKQANAAHPHPSKTEVLKKLNRSTRAITGSTILPLLKKQGATELTLADVRKMLSVIKTPLSHEIIAERKNN